MKHTLKRFFISAIFFITLPSIFACVAPPIDELVPLSVDESDPEAKPIINRAGLGEVIYTHIHSPENGNITVRVDIPSQPRYGESVPVVVVASTWFVEKYNLDQTPFHLEFNPVSSGMLVVTHLWPGKTDPESGLRSDGVYDYGGPNSLAALRDTIRFALGKTVDTNGNYLADLILPVPLYENVGLFASSHAGVVATNVMAYYGDSFPELKYFVGRENPTMAEMYPLEIGHF